MQINILQENQIYSFIELKDLFNITDDKLNNIINKLLLMNIIKKLSLKNSTNKLSDLFFDDDFEEINLQNTYDNIIFKYVGIIIIGEICLILYPKYIDNYLDDKNNNFQILRQLIAVIKKYHSKEQKFGIDTQSNAEYFNILSIAIELISNYYEYGLYSHNNEITEENGNGEILWEKTINDTIPIFSQNIPIYLDFFTVNQKEDDSNYFKRLHAFILSDICNKLKPILNILGEKDINLSDENITQFGDQDYILSRLNYEMSSQFISYKLNILNLMKKYIMHISSRAIEQNISLIGTNCFNLVWEDVCSVFMDNCFKKSLKELNLVYSKNKNSSLLISDIIPKPKWTHNKSGAVHYDSHTLIPDIITIKDGKLSIYDAKYYKIKLDKDCISNYPKVTDITKQYIYAIAYIEFMNENNLIMDKNAFILPTEHDTEEIIGKVSIEMFQTLESIHIKDIDIILLPCYNAYKKYLQN